MNKVQIVLSSYDTSCNLADFEVTLSNLDVCSCHAKVDLIDFSNGDVNINPSHWFDHNEDHMDKPEEFGNYERHLLNECFEKNVGKFL